MPAIRHALSGAIYDLGDDGLVLVEHDGSTGRFDREGGWVSGDIRTADPELCRWISDPRAVSRHRRIADTQAPTGPPESSAAGGHG